MVKDATRGVEASQGDRSDAATGCHSWWVHEGMLVVEAAPDVAVEPLLV